MNNMFDSTKDELFSALATLETPEEFRKFITDICTIKEIHEMSQRLSVAKMLTDGKIYTDIEKKTGASTATISRVSRALRYGEGGYGIALRRLSASETEKENSKGNI